MYALLPVLEIALICLYSQNTAREWHQMKDVFEFFIQESKKKEDEEEELFVS